MREEKDNRRESNVSPGVVRQEATGKQEDIINAYERRSEQIRQAQADRLAAIKTIIEGDVEANREYLSYAQAKGWFKLTPEEEEETALLITIIGFTGNMIGWEVGKARKLSYLILEEVNDHGTCSKVKELVEGRSRE